MTPSSPVNPNARIAILGAATLEGVRVREALQRARIPGKQVDLFGAAAEEMVISEYGGDARLIQPAEPGALEDHQVLFVCERSTVATELIDRKRDRQFVFDLVAGLPDRAATRLVGPQESGAAALEPGFYAVPYPLALVLAELLHPIESGPGVSEVVAVVLRPAADYGEHGVEELQEQTVRILNCVEMPTATFGRQLAFNIIPENGLSCAVPGLESLISQQVGRLLGWDRERLALRFLAAPLFYGHAVELRLRTPNGATLADLERAFDGSELQRESGGGQQVSTPMEVANARAIRVGELSSDGLGGFWLWAVAGGIHSKAADLAVDLARRAIGC